MANGNRIPLDENRRTVIAGVSSADGVTIEPVEVDPSTGRLLVNATLTGTTKQPSASTITSVGDTTSSTTLLSANTSRLEAEFYNNSTAVLYLLKGSGTASSMNFTVALNQGDYYTTDYTGQTNGVWASDTGGYVLVTESE